MRRSRDHQDPLLDTLNMGIPTFLLSPEHDFDFTDVYDGGRCQSRGNAVYERPCGWQRFGIKCCGKYDNGSDRWLGETNAAWANSYHGTTREALRNILITGHNGGSTGFDLQHHTRHAHGVGVYSSPHVSAAESFATAFSAPDGSQWKCVLQCRVDLRDPTNVVVPHTAGNVVGSRYYLSPSPDGLRPYAILLRKVADAPAPAAAAALSSQWTCNDPEVTDNEYDFDDATVRAIEAAYQNGQPKVGGIWCPIGERVTVYFDAAGHWLKLRNGDTVDVFRNW